MAADSQEGTGYGGDFKQSVGKLSIFSAGYMDRETGVAGDHLRFVYLVLGDSGYIDVVKTEIIERFQSMGRNPDLDIFGRHLKRVIRSFFSKHVIPFGESPNMDLRVQFIVAVQSGGERRLWLTNLTTVMQPQLYTVIGSGGKWALSVIPPRIFAADEKRAAVAAAYAVYVAKSHAEGCGGDTIHLVLVSTKELDQLQADGGAVVELEKCFKKYRVVERYCCMGLSSVYRD